MPAWHYCFQKVFFSRYAIVAGQARPTFECSLKEAQFWTFVIRVNDTFISAFLLLSSLLHFMRIHS